MDVKKATYEIQFTDKELWSLGLLIVSRLEHSIKTHYTHLQSEKDGEESFFKQEDGKLGMMKFFFELIGRADITESYMQQFKHLFAEERRKRDENKS